MLLAMGAKEPQYANLTPIHETGRGGFTKAAKILLYHGGGIDAWWPAPIALAAQRGHANMVIFLLEQRSQLDLECSGRMVLGIGGIVGYESVVRALDERGVDVKCLGEKRPTLLKAIL